MAGKHVVNEKQKLQIFNIKTTADLKCKTENYMLLEHYCLFKNGYTEDLFSIKCPDSTLLCSELIIVASPPPCDWQ